LPADLRRRRPRSYIEWKTLRRWGRLPAWENDPPGYLLRLAREQASLTQEELAQVLGVSQQAVARAERAGSNPTVELIERWARQCGRELRWSLE
jgi:DNA-binding XRE family transcriptional regulator